MPLINDSPLNVFVRPLPDPVQPVKPPEPTNLEMWQAAARTENDMVATIDMMTQPPEKIDLNFNLIEAAKKRNVDPGNFTDALNETHFDRLIKKRDQEIKDNAVLDQSGWSGFFARTAMGIASPTSLLPILGEGATGLRMMASVGLNAAAGAAIQEGILFADQRTRTKTQAAYSIGSSLILGSALGAIAHTMSKSVLDKMAHDMDHSPNAFTISSPPPGVLDAGAADATHLNDAGKLKKGWGAQLLSPMSGITRNFEQWNAPAYLKEAGGSQQLRKMTAGFSQASLTLEENKKFLAASPGGNVEDLKRTYAAFSYDGSKILENSYIQYILGTDAGGLFKKQRAIMAGAKRPDGKLTYGEFKRQIALDMWSNFSREGVPDMVRKAAKDIDERIYKRLYDEGVKVGIFTGKEKTIGDENYANRVYNNEVIMRRHNEFVKILADHYRESLDKDFSAQLTKLQESMSKDKQLFEDANLPFDKAQQLRDDLLNAGVDLQNETNPEILKGVEAIKANTKAINDLRTELDNLKKIKTEGSDVEGLQKRKDRMDEIEAALTTKALENENVRKTLGTELEKYQQSAKEIRRRLNNINKNTSVQDVKMRKKLDKIGANEDAQVTTILRAQKQLQKFIKMLESVSDDKLDAELSKLKDLFHKNAEQYDKLEARLQAYLNDGPELPGEPPKSVPPDETPPPETPPSAPPKIDIPPTEIPPNDLTPEVEAKIKDIVESNLTEAFDQVNNYVNIKESVDSYWVNIHDTLKEQGMFSDKTLSFAEDLYFKKAEKLIEEQNKNVGPLGLPKLVEDDIQKLAEYNAKLTYDNYKDFMSLDNAKQSYKADMIDTLQLRYPQAWTRYKPIVEKLFEEKIAAGKAAHDLKVAEEAKIKKWKQPESRLHNMSRQDLEYAGLTKEEIEKIYYMPGDYKDVLDKLHKGYKFYPDGTFRQITQEEVDAAQQAYLDGEQLAQKLRGEIYQKFADAGDSKAKLAKLIPNHPEPMTYEEAYNKVNELFQHFSDNYKAAHNVWDRAARRKEKPGVWPNLEPGTIESLGRQGGGAEIEKNPKAYRLNPDLNVAAAYFRTTKDAVAWLELHGTKEQKLIVHRIKDHMHDAAFFLVDSTGKDPRYSAHRDFITDRKTERAFRGVYLRERFNHHPTNITAENISRTRAALLLNNQMGGINPKTLTHELLHASLTTRINYGQTFPKSRLGRLVTELEDLRQVVLKEIQKQGNNEHYVHYAASNLQEMGANALTDPTVWDFFRKVQYKGRPLYTRFVDLFRNVLGIPKNEESAFTHLLDITDKMLKEKDPAKFNITPYRVPSVDTPFRPITLRGVATPEEAALEKLRAETPSDGKPFAREASDPPEMKMSDKMDQLAKKMDGFAEKIDNLNKFDREGFRLEINDMMKELADTHARINAKRVIRNERLWKQVENLSPEARARRMVDLQLKMKERPLKFLDRWNTKNAGDMRMNTDTGLLEGNGNFTQHAEDMAKETVGKIMGIDRRLAFSDIIKDKRGPELARVLNIPSDKIKDFLETDVEKMLAIYTRTVGSDISIARVFGTPDAAEDFAKLTDEQQNMLAKIETMTDKEGKPLDTATKEKMQYETNQFYNEGRKNLMVLLERAKGMRGIPKDAASWSARGAKMAMDINFMRMMGNVVVSSIADPARLVMKYGLTRTFRDAFLPMITDWKTIRMSQREALLAGSGLDPVLHSRAYSLTDIFDDAHRGTAIEKATHWASTKMGLVAGFDHWTSAIKQITAGAANAKLLDNIAAIMEGKLIGKDLIKAQEFLSRNNLDADFVERIWKQVTTGEGGGKVNGIWLPNTDNWTDDGARRAYRAALGGEIDSTIVTPGFERPNWVDSSIPARMVAQFKSFGFTSTQKTLMAGLQEHDIAFFNGVMSSLALGALSYYLYAVAAGGKTYEEMMNAGSDKWADEAISRSGVTAIFDEAQRIATRIPLLQKYASFSGKQTTRRGGGDLVSEVLGPSYDLMERAFKVSSEIDSPTKSTLHTVRTILPLQNVFYLRRLINKIEEAAGSGLPKRRTQ